MNYLVTGAAGFIGMHTCLKLLKHKHRVIGLDNINNYYSKSLKLSRLKILKKFKKFKFFKIDINDKNSLKKVFNRFSLTHVIHLAAQAGVRYSIQNPSVYTHTNLNGTSNILELSKEKNIKHLILASSSSVYGGNTKTPFSESDNVDHPISYYAATKKSNEIMAHSYSHLFKVPVTCLRFFTVYGPWGRPDMSLFLFTKAIKEKKPIKIFNRGKMFRDFTYIDDIVEAIYRILQKKPKNNFSKAPFKILNIGSNKPVNLENYIKIIETNLNKKAKKKYLPMQPGDAKFTHANLSELNKWINFKPKTKLSSGIKKFINWYEDYYEKKKY